MTLGENDALGEDEYVVSSHYTTKVRVILCTGCDDVKEVRILKQHVRWNSDGQKS